LIAWAVALALAAVIAAVAYALCLEPRWLRVRERLLPVPDLPPALEGITIAHLSDLHLTRRGPDDLALRAVRAIVERRPDLVVVTGDITQHGQEAKVAADALRPLAALECLAVLGNHDLRAGQLPASRLAAAVADAGVPVLRDSSQIVTLRGQTVRVVGVDVTRAAGGPGLRGVIDQLPSEDGPRILLTHSPSALRDLRRGDALLALVGHTHGGQIFIPIVTWLHLRLVFAGLGDGIGYRNGVPVHTSRGLATSQVRARFLRRPEVTILTLTRSTPRSSG
jgi:predicted MPP superfamily phosphohydrolase